MATAAAKEKAATKPRAGAKPAAKKPAAKPAARRAVGRPVASTSARTVAVEILRGKGGEIQVSELARLVVESGKVKLGGKTPSATVAAHIYVAAKKGELFRKTRRGCVELIPEASPVDATS